MEAGGGDEKELHNQIKSFGMIDEGNNIRNIFSPEVSWFVYDFFKHDLNGYEKLLFYCYYVLGYTLKEVAGAHDCTWQLIGQRMKVINEKIRKRWITNRKYKVLDGS
jgi:hypothetical protein